MLGREVTFSALGRQWTAARWDIGLLDRFLDWVRPQLPDPFAGLERVLDKLPAAEATRLLKEAEHKRDEQECLDYDSPVVKRFLNSKRGRLYMFLLLLRVHQPATTLGQAVDVAQELGGDRLSELFGQVAGDYQGNPPAPGTSS